MQFVPHDYQRYCIGKILDTPKLGLFLDMGLGKTVITLTAIRQLMYDRFQVRRVLVIAPKKVAEGTWTLEKGSTRKYFVYRRYSAAQQNELRLCTRRQTFT